MDIGKQLDKIRQKKNMSKNELARLSNLSRSGLSNILENKKSPTLDTVFRICDALNVPLVRLFCDVSGAAQYDNELLGLFENANRQAKKIALFALETGQEKKLPGIYKLIDTPSDSSGCDELTYVTIPVVGRAAAGTPIEMIAEYDDSISVDDRQIKRGDFAVIASGDSMIEAGIHDGDRVVIRPHVEVNNGEIALIAVGDGSTIKRLYWDDAGCRLVSANPAYEPQHYGPDDSISILGKFIKVVNKEDP